MSETTSVEDMRPTGGCQCGAVRFAATGPFKVAICHCRMCQKAFGNYFAPLVTAKSVEWTRGEPALFRSSNHAQRGFCAKCGTPLVYLGGVDWGPEIAGGAFDDPSALPPTIQINVKDRVAFFGMLTDVPHHTNVDKEAAFNATVTSCQHPDHDTATWPPTS